jgi:hypothetical protein
MRERKSKIRSDSYQNLVLYNPNKNQNTENFTSRNYESILEVKPTEFKVKYIPRFKSHKELPETPELKQRDPELYR